MGVRCGSRIIITVCETTAEMETNSLLPKKKIHRINISSFIDHIPYIKSIDQVFIEGRWGRWGRLQALGNRMEAVVRASAFWPSVRAGWEGDENGLQKQSRGSRLLFIFFFICSPPTFPFFLSLFALISLSYSLALALHLSLSLSPSLFHKHKHSLTFTYIRSRQ